MTAKDESASDVDAAIDGLYQAPHFRFREVKRLLPKKSIFATLRPTMKTFENKTVLITGGTSGIGKATAVAFAKEGANVVVSGRRVAEGEEVAREITSAGGSAFLG